MSAKKSNPQPPSSDDLLSSEAPLSEAAARLAFTVPVAEGPSPRVKEALLARVRADAAASAGWRFTAVAANEGWVTLPFPGVRMREVTIDRERDTAMLYVEMVPGSIFPEHVHTAPERGLVLTGDFQTGERLLRAGDFYEAAAGTQHVRISSPSGCTGLLWVGAQAWDKWRAAMASH